MVIHPTAHTVRNDRSFGPSGLKTPADELAKQPSTKTLPGNLFPAGEVSPVQGHTPS